MPQRSSHTFDRVTMQPRRLRRLSNVTEEIPLKELPTRGKRPSVSHLPPLFIQRLLKSEAFTPGDEHTYRNMKYQVVDTRIIVQFPCDGISKVRPHTVDVLQATPSDNRTPIRFPDLTKFFPAMSMDEVDYMVYRNARRGDPPYTYLLFHSRAPTTVNMHFPQSVKGDAFVAAVKNPDGEVWDRGVCGVMYADVPWSVQSQTFNYRTARNILGSPVRRYESLAVSRVLAPPSVPLVMTYDGQAEDAESEGGQQETSVWTKVWKAWRNVWGFCEIMCSGDWDEF